MLNGGIFYAYALYQLFFGTTLHSLGRQPISSDSDWSSGVKNYVSSLN